MRSKVLVVGGGTAGWLTAALVAAERIALGDTKTDVTLIESADIPTIGVGEGTWPSMRATLKRVGIAESDLLRHAQASFKQGTKFVGWSGQSESDVYYHPFSLPGGDGALDLAPYWLAHGGRRKFAEFVTAQSQVINRGLAPKQLQTPDYAFAVNYAYHLDAGKFADLVKRHAITSLGVRHQIGTVEQVIGEPGAHIKALKLSSGETIEADLFVDCTGQAALLIEGHMHSRHLDMRHVLFNDSAIAVQVPHAASDTPIASATLSTATKIGWIWDIALPGRRGIGHVFSSGYGSESEAMDILKDYLAADASLAAGYLVDDAYRHIRFEPGYRERFWVGNCVSVGMCAGFIEPLEASAIALIEQSAGLIARWLPRDRHLTEIVAKRFNDKFSHHWQQIIAFLKLHYALSVRDDSEYWRAHRSQSTWPQSLAENLALWQHRPPDHTDAPMVDELFPSESFQYVLYGMGFRPREIRQPPRGSAFERAETTLGRVRELARQYADGLPSNRTLINSMLMQDS